MLEAGYLEPYTRHCMFTETWHRRWGLKQAPFAHEDADRDPLLERVDTWAVHRSYERLLGSDGRPTSAVIFGERGSGKSALRRSVARGLAASGKSVAVEITDVDPWLEIFQGRVAQGDSATDPTNAFAGLRRADLIDLFLSAALMRLGEVLEGDPARFKRLRSSDRAQLTLLMAAYHPDWDGGRTEQVMGLLAVQGQWLRRALVNSMGIVGAAACLAPLMHLAGWWPLGPETILPVAASGAGLLGFLAARSVWLRIVARRTAVRIANGMRITNPHGPLLRRVLIALPRRGANGLSQESETTEEGRYRLLRGLIQLVRKMGWSGIEFLVDRIDESNLLGSRADCMGSFIDPVLEHKLLQLDGLGLKLFLPMELTPMVRGAGPERLRRMRLDKAALVDEMRWSGQELMELADRRLAAASHGPAVCVADLLSKDLDVIEMRDALHGLGTPRLVFSFLRDLFEDHARELPDDLPRDSPEWLVSRAAFEHQRAAWSDHARALRRSMRQQPLDCSVSG